MKLLSLALAMTLATFGFQTTYAQDGSTINWMTLEEAMAKQETNPKKIFIDVYTSWCGPCKMLDKNTFQHPDVVAYVNEHYYAVKFNAESPDPVNFNGKVYKNPTYDPAKKGRNGVHELSRFFQVTAYPSMMFLSPDGTAITKAEGYLQPTQLEYYLKTITEEVYLRLKTEEEWKKYQEEFNYTFK